MSGGLQRTVGAVQFFTLSFGCIIGVGWIVALPVWLAAAGPGGAALAFIIGGLAMILVGVCYAELATAFPVTGGEVAYAYSLYGPRTSFATGWFLALSSIATTAFEAISLGWIAAALVPGLEGPALYNVAGEPVRLGSLVVGIAGTALLTWLNYRGAGAASRLQDILTWGLLATSAWFIAAGLIRGSAEHLEPLFAGTSDRAWWRGVLSVMATAPFWYAGFDVIPQMMGERTHGSSLRAAGVMIIVSIAVAAAFYVLVIVSSAMTMPWRDLLVLPMPAAEGFRRAFHSELLAQVVLVAAVLGPFTIYASLPNLQSMVAEIVPPKRLGLTFAVHMLFLAGAGTALGPFLVGWASDATGSLRTALVVPLIAAMLSAVGAIVAERIVRARPPQVVS